MSEAILTSHLTISYSPTPAAGGPAAPGGNGAAPGAAAGEEGPGGFLAALIDQLLAGAATAPSGGDAQAVASSDATSPVPLPFGTAIDPAAAAAVRATPQGDALLAQLTRQLRALEDDLDKGETPDADLMKKLEQTVDAIAALIVVPNAPEAMPISPETQLDPLGAIEGNRPAPAAEPAAITASGPQASSVASAAADQLAQYIASLSGNAGPSTPTGYALPSESTTASASGDGVMQPPLPGIAKLAETLKTLSGSIASDSPQLAQKLVDLGQKLEAAEQTPQVLAQLATTADPDATQLDTVVQALLNKLDAVQPAGARATTVSPAQPQVLSATIAPTPPVPPATATTAGQRASTNGAQSATHASTSVDAFRETGDTPKPEAKLVAEATTQADPKGTADNPQQQPAGGNAVPPAPPGLVATPRILPAAYQAAANPINVGQVAFEMIRQMHEGSSRFTIRLDPPELGRVDVRMHVDATGSVNARLTVDRAETLDMFQRDRSTLERALSQAGLDGTKTNLQFTLRQNPFAGMGGNFQRPSGGSTPAPRLSSSAAGGDDGIAAVPAVTLYRGVASSGGVNIFV